MTSSLTQKVPELCYLEAQHFVNEDQPSFEPPRPMPSAPVAGNPGRIGLAGPAWTRGEIERPAGTKDMGGWKASAGCPVGRTGPGRETGFTSGTISL